MIEAMTYRRKGHAEHDNQSYIPEGEIEWWAKHNDPITRYERFLTQKRILTRKQMGKIEAEIKDFLQAESDWAEKAPLPEAEEAARNVFDNGVVKPAYKKKVLER